MIKSNEIQYLHDTDTGMELILCFNSAVSYPLHNHISVVIIGMVLHGTIDLSAGDRVYICRKDQPFMILPYIPHTIKAKEPYSLLTICINKDSINQGNREEIKSEIHRLLMNKTGWPISEGQSVGLLNCLNLFSSVSYPYIHSEMIDTVKKQIECYPEKKFSIEEMSRRAFTSKYHFIRSFKQAVGLTPRQFQIQNRIRKAQHMLNHTDSMAEVAVATGFCDQSHFIKLFKKYVGLTPTDYKISCRFLSGGFPI